MVGMPKRRRQKDHAKKKAAAMLKENPDVFSSAPGPVPDGEQSTKGGYIVPPGGVGPGRPPIRPKGNNGRTREEIAAEVLRWYARVPMIKTACKRARVLYGTFQEWMNEDSDFGRQVRADLDEAQANQVIILAERLQDPEISSASVKGLSLLVSNYSQHEISLSTKQVNHTVGVDASLAGLLAKASKDAARPSLPSRPHTRQIEDAEIIDVTPEEEEERGEGDSDE